MKKYNFLWLLAAFLLMPLGAGAQSTDTVFVGDVASTASEHYVPFTNYFHHGWTETRYSPSDIGQPGVITSVSWYCSATASLTFNEMKIYMGVADDSVFASTSSWTSLDDLTLVYEGTNFTIGDNIGWKEFQLDAPFVYSDISKSLVIVVAKTQSSYSNSQKWQYTTKTGNRALYRQNDSDASYYSHPGTSSGTGKAYIPNIRLAMTPMGDDFCYPPTGVTVSDITDNTAIITWSGHDNDNGYNYVIAPAGFSPDTMDLEFTTETTLNVSSLASNTLYGYAVQSVCSDSSVWRTGTFRTACSEYLDLPFHEDFDSYASGNGSLPFCWYVLSTYSTTSATYPYVYTTTNAHSGKALYFYSSTNTPNLVCTPLVLEDANNLLIRFWLAASNNGTFQVGLMSDTADATTFEPLFTLNGNNTTKTEYDVYTDTTSLASPVYVAFRWTASSGYSAYLDDVQISVAPDCHRPTSPYINAITYNSAHIGWTDATNIMAYEVRYSTVNDLETEEGAAYENGISETEVTLNNLNPGTTYYAWVRTNCGSSQSDWTYCGTFATDYTCYPISSYNIVDQSFTALSLEWTYGNNGRGYEPTGVTITYTDVTDSNDHTTTTVVVEGETSTIISGLVPGHTYTASIRTLCDPDSSMATPDITINMPTCGTVTGSTTSSYTPFYGLYNYGYSQVLYPASVINGMSEVTGLQWEITSPASSSTTRTIDVWIGSTTVNTLSTSSYIDTTQMTKVVTNGALAVGAAGWTGVTFDSPWTPGDGSNVVVAVVNKTGSWNGITWRGHTGIGVYGYQDPVPSDSYNLNSYNSKSTTTDVADIRFVGDCELTCLPPMARIVETQTESITLEWVAGGDETSWTVEYKVDGDSTWQVAESSTSSTSTTVSGLEPRTPYLFRIGAPCEDGTIYSNPIIAYTGCDDITLPFTEGFEVGPYGAGTTPLCWNKLDFATSTSHKAYVNTSTKHSGNRAMYFYPYGWTYLVGQQLPEEQLNNLEISFFASISNSGSTRLEAGLMTDPNDTSTFVTFATMTGNGSTWTEYIFYTDTTSISSEAYLAFRIYCSNGYSTYLDDITIDEIHCKRPTGFAIQQLMAHEVTLKWDHGTVDNYEVQVFEVGGDTISDTISITGITDTTVTIENLNANSNYHAMMRRVCDGYVSSWFELNFSTPCEAYTMPFVENFDTTVLSNCWGRYRGIFDTVPTLTAATSPYFNVTTYYNTIMTESNYVRFNVYGTYNSWLVTPGIEISEDAVLTFDVALSDYSYASGSGTATNPYTYAVPDSGNTTTRFVVAVTTDGGTTWQPIGQWGRDTSRDDHPYSELTNVARSYSLPLIGYTGQTVRIAFYSGQTVTGDDNWIWLDNISVQSADCMLPFGLGATTTATSATVTFEDVSTEPAGYELVISPTNDPADEDATTVQLENGVFTYTFTGLEPSTQYYLFVRGLCNENEAWASATTKTQCVDPELPLDEDFESYATTGYVVPDCWSTINRYNSSGTLYPYVYQSSNTAHGKVMYMYNYSSYNNEMLVSPRIPEPLNNLYVSFDYSRSNGRLEVYAATDPADQSTYHLLYTADALNSTSSTYVEHEFYTDTLSVTDTGYIVFMAPMNTSSTNSGYLDNVHIGLAGDCRRPGAITVSDIDYYSATLAWPEQETATNGYRLRYGIENNYSLATDSVDVNDNTVDLTGLQNGTTYYVWLQMKCADNSLSDIREGSFTTEVSCYTVTNLTADVIGQGAAGFSWGTSTQGQDAQGFIAEIIDMENNNALSSEAITETSHFFTGLVPGHPYRVRIYTICDPDTSAALYYNFTTMPIACGNITGNDTTSGYGPIYGLYKHGYTQMLFKANEISDLDTITSISFSIATTPSSHPVRDIDIYIGHTSRNSITTSGYVPVDSLTLVVDDYGMDVTSTGWVTIGFTTPFAYNGTDNLVIAVQNHTGEWSSFNWDVNSTSFSSSIIWYSDTYTCEPDDPTTFPSSSYSHNYRPDVLFGGNCGVAGCYSPLAMLTDVTATSASVNWVAGGTETAWTVEYRTVGADTWTTAIANTTDNEYTITGLTPTTAYEMRIGALCDEGTTYSVVIPFTTALEPNATLPFSTGFEASDDDNWIFINGANAWVKGTDVNNGGSGSLYISNDGTTNAYDNGTSSNSYAFLCFNMPAGTYVSSYDYRVNGESDYDYLRVFLAPTTATPSVNAPGTISLDGNMNLQLQTEWTTRTDTFNITNAGDYVVVFYWRNDGSAGSNPSAAIDNFSIGIAGSVIPEPECQTPTGLTATNITNTSASINWTPAGDEILWDILFNGQTIPVTARPYNLTGLTKNTSYTVRVRANCGDGDVSLWSDPYTFTTTNVGIDDVTEGSFGMYPNPASNAVTLDFSGLDLNDATVTLIDLNGRTVYSGKADTKTTIDLTGFARGTYFVRLTTTEGIAVRKLIVQ